NNSGVSLRPRALCRRMVRTSCRGTASPHLPRNRTAMKRTHLAVALLSLASFSIAKADVPRALPAGTLPDDVRLQPPKDLNGYFPFAVPKSKGEWDKRAEYVRRQILVSQGLWPMPTKTPLNAVIHGKLDFPEYTVEKGYFESAPGFFVT